MSEKQKIDWQAVHRKLDESSHLLKTAFEPTPEEVDRTLAARAEQLARRQATAGGQTTGRTVLLLAVGENVAGIEIHWIQEVVNLGQSPTLVPDAHELLLGVVNVHNQLVTLVNPEPLLNESAAAATAGEISQAVLLRHPQLKVAIGCAQVLDLVELPDAAWQSDRLFFFNAEQTPGVLLDVRSLLQSWEKQA